MGIKKSVYFVGNRYDGCYYVRCILPLIHNGWNGAQTSLYGQKASQGEMAQSALDSDIVVFQRPDTKKHTEIISMLKKAGKKIVFDNDDTYAETSGFGGLKQIALTRSVKRVNEEIYKNVRQADLITTTTKTLAKEYKDLNVKAPVVVLPNMVDPYDYPEPKRNKGDKVRIGLVGSVAYGDFKLIWEYIEELSKRKDVQLVFMGMSKDIKNRKPSEDPLKNSLYEQGKEFIKFLDLSIEWQPNVPMKDYSETLNNLKLDIMLIPRYDTYFNKCKSNIKFLEASMLEIPVVASSFPSGPYEEIEQGETGYKAKDINEFKKYTEKLINNKELRRKIGKQAKEYVLSKYNIEDNAHLWADAYKLIK